jgi:integrase/recombinase XerD
LSGRSVPSEIAIQSVCDAVNLFIKDKQVQGVTEGVVAKYTRELARLLDFCERHSIHAVRGLTR